MLIDSNTMLTVKAYDVENDEYQSQQMSIAEMLDEWTEEGCPEAAASAEREAIPPMKLTFEKGIIFFACMDCKAQLTYRQPFCSMCGLAVKWDG